MKPTHEELERLYNKELLTTRQIGAIFGVSKTHILRWLKSYDIVRRPPHSGAWHRGITPPSEGTLNRLVHEDHRSYREIASLYKVDPTTVGNWLKSFNLPLADIWITRRKGPKPLMPDAATLAQRYRTGESITDIATDYGVSERALRPLFDEYDIPVRSDGWNGGIRFVCDDGHRVRSNYEQRVDNWLYEHGVEHSYEPTLPFDRRSAADFLANGWYIEVWGVIQNAPYKKRQARKQALYKEHHLPLIEIPVHAFDKRRNRMWERRLATCLSPAATG